MGTFPSANKKRKILMTKEKLDTNTEDFGALLDEFMATRPMQGQVVKGTITALTKDEAIVDVGLKSEGRIPLTEFGTQSVKVGDEVEVYIERYENREGSAVLSREKARREEAWAI